MVGTTAEQTSLGLALLTLAVVIDCVDIGDGDVVHLLHRVLDLKLVGFTINDKAITVQLFALSRQLLCNDWLNNDSHLLVLLCSLCEDVLNAVDEYQGIGIHDGVGVDLVNGNYVDMLEIAG